MKSTITRERIQRIIRAIDSEAYDEEEIREWLSSDEIMELSRMALAAMDSEPVILYRERNPYNGLTTGWQELTENELSFLKENAGENAEFLKLYRHAQPATERDQVRSEHAEWSQATFGNVGPVGPLKHLSKEALEAAAEPGDLSEWADMQFLLWDAQRRAGITDEQITQAMIEKLVVNKQREWPEPKGGEPRLHIKAQPVPVVPDAATAIRACLSEFPESARDIVEECADIAENACRAAMFQPLHTIKAASALGSLPKTGEVLHANSPVIPDTWIPVSEQMPENDESKPIAIFTGKCLGQGIFVATYDDNGFFDFWEGMEIFGVTHWMPLPAAPQEVRP